ncbi:MAG: type II asparaginase [Duodenibacillus sp.]|nr:type II asparaginase [Duodenibacillus sp.]
MQIKKCVAQMMICASLLGVAAVSVAAEPAAQVQTQAKPNVCILATGGTIAGSAASATQMTGYKAGALAIDVLLNAVPEIHKIANVRGEQIASIGSNDMTHEIWLKLANRVNELLADPKVDSVIITHGTDTLEETAYFLNLVVKSDKPVIMIGAMRPATAMSADGPVNILNAVTLAATPEAKGRGVMIAMNDCINGARDVTKTNTLRVDTFQNHELGYLGYFEGGKPSFYKATTRKHTTASEFDIKGLKDLPRVDIVYSHVNDDGKLVEAAVAAGAKGIIHAGTGNGSIHCNTTPALAQAVKQGVVVVRGARLPYGPTIVSDAEWEEAGFLNAGTLSVQKARILLQLALTKTNDPKKIAEMFRQY